MEGNGTRPKHRRDGNLGPRSDQSQQNITLDAHTSDLNLTLDDRRLIGTPLTKDGFAYMWAGARASHGVRRGKVCYEMMVLEHLNVSHLSIKDSHTHIVRIGFSTKDSSLQLGEDTLSYGFGGTGKIVYDSQYFKYGRPYLQGDVITAFLAFEGRKALISFALNGIHQGEALEVDKDILKGRALYPHVITKNCRFQVNFAQDGKCYYALPPGYENYSFMGRVQIRDLEWINSPSLEPWEVLMMCGLPGSGKSSWVRNHCKKNQEKNYYVLGTDNIMERMKIIGLPKGIYADRFEVLFKLANVCYEKLLKIASHRLRNYILDQTNVYPSAQKRKMRSFSEFRRVAVVVVPNDKVYQDRILLQRQSGKVIPDSTIFTMKANFVLPAPGEVFHEVSFVELQFARAQILVSSYNQEAVLNGFQSNIQQSDLGTDVTTGLSNLDLNRGNQRQAQHLIQRGGQNSGHLAPNSGQRGQNSGQRGGQRSDYRGGQRGDQTSGHRGGGGQNSGQRGGSQSGGQNLGHRGGSDQNSGHRGSQNWASRRDGGQIWGHHGGDQNSRHRGNRTNADHNAHFFQQSYQGVTFSESDDSDSDNLESSSGHRGGFRRRRRGRGARQNSGHRGGQNFAQWDTFGGLL